MVKQLIVNADDFGYTRGVNRAIIHAFRNGIVTSTSLLANGSAFEDAVALAKLEPGLDVGCHLNLVEGTPLSPTEQIPHLVAENGKFYSASRLALRLFGGAVPAAELELECSAQIEKLIQAGIRPSHLDSHQHTHLHPRVAGAVANVASRYSIGWVRRPFENYWVRKISGLRLRRAISMSVGWLGPRFERRLAAQGLRMPDFFTGFELTGRWTKQALEETLAALRPGITELMCHPGYCDAELEGAKTSLKLARQRELEIMADGSWRTRLRELGIVPTGYGAISFASPQPVPNQVMAVAASAGSRK
jgi:hopanoid biosynthesis associated protein HpnK